MTPSAKWENSRMRAVNAPMSIPYSICPPEEMGAVTGSVAIKTDAKRKPPEITAVKGSMKPAPVK